MFENVMFICIFMILGIGLEVILFVVIIDSEINVKYLLVDFVLIFDVVIIDF